MKIELDNCSIDFDANKKIDFTVNRKWYEFWKPKTWTERDKYNVVIDCKNNSIDGVIEELKRLG